MLKTKETEKGMDTGKTATLYQGPEYYQPLDMTRIVLYLINLSELKITIGTNKSNENNTQEGGAVSKTTFIRSIGHSYTKVLK